MGVQRPIYFQGRCANLGYTYRSDNMKRWVIGFAALTMLLGAGQADASIMVAFDPGTADPPGTSVGFAATGNLVARMTAAALFSDSLSETVLFAVASGLGSFDIAAPRAGEVALAGFPSLGDLCRPLEIRFPSAWGFDGDPSFTFAADTANLKVPGDIELDLLPEPASLAIWSLIGLSFAGAGWWRRRRGSVDWADGNVGPALRLFRVPKLQHGKKGWPEEVTVTIKRMIDRHGVI